MKIQLGLDIGTNSIGWALIENDFDKKEGRILGLGSRIIPMTADVLGAFENGGVLETATAQRTQKRLMRRMYQRRQLRRERLLRVLNVMDFLPSHFSASIDFSHKKGQFIDGKKTLLPYKPSHTEGKTEFLFKKSYDEMVRNFKENGHNENLPYDWTIYFLRKKALYEMISKHELSWLLLHFNQKRGYYQSREETEDKDTSKREEYLKCKIIDVQKTGDKKGAEFWFEMTLDNGLVYKRAGDDKLFDWKGSDREFVLTTQLDGEGNPALNKSGEVKYSFRAPEDKDWGLIKLRTENAIDEFNRTHKTVGTGIYIYETLLEEPSQKIVGGLVRTVERKYHKEELTAILEHQSKYHPEFTSNEMVMRCAKELYSSNEVHQNSLLKKNLTHLLINDILFYQRPLKSKKSDISDCQFESRFFRNNDGTIQKRAIKSAPKSHPLYEEFRALQFLHNLRVYKKDFNDSRNSGGLVDVTSELISSINLRETLLAWMLSEEKIDQDAFLKFLLKSKIISKKDKDCIRWNYAEDSWYPIAPARAQIINRLKRAGIEPEWLSKERHLQLWHIIYSVKDLVMYRKALKTFSGKNDVDQESFLTAFQSHKPYESSYGAYSVKALSKLLPLMRFGSNWHESKIEAGVVEKIKALETDIKQFKEFEEEFKKKTTSSNHLTALAGSEQRRAMIKSFARVDLNKPIQGLNTYQACYAVYGRHSENSDVAFWDKPEDIERYLKEFKAMSLRNPIVEQIILETLRIVKDIWKRYGQGKPNFFDEIHLELARDLKKPRAEREKISKRYRENEATNLRIRAILQELANDPTIEGDVRPFSPSQQEILKLYEEGALSSQEIPEDIAKISRSADPTKAEIAKYKLWLAQRYLSPYTGQIIPLSKLFTQDYEIEHVIPKARYFDDSLSNKIICESVVNSIKGSQTGLEFIKNHGGSVVDLGQGRSTTILNEEAYRATCQRIFSQYHKKLEYLLSEDIPEGFINRQLNDTRHISRLVMGLLSNIVRNENETSFRVTRLIPLNGSITSQMKKDWGLNDIWNRIIQPRFERLNKITNSSDYGYFDSSINAFRIQVPAVFQRGFKSKRIDHRHHGLDALVIAAVTTDHVNYLNSLNSTRNNETLRKKLLTIEKIESVDMSSGEITTHHKKSFTKPWPYFTSDALSTLESTLISFKIRHRVINRTTNKYWSYTDENGQPYTDKNGRKVKNLTPQIKGDAWSIRRQLHNDGISGKVKLRRVTDSQIPINKAIINWENIADRQIRLLIKDLLFNKFGGDYTALSKHLKKEPLTIENQKVEHVSIINEFEATAKRMELTSSFTEKNLEKLTDTGIQKILKRHLESYPLGNGKFDYATAFSQEGLSTMNSNIKALNKGKDHKPIKFVRVYEVSQRFQVGQSPNSSHKYVESAKGSNLFFAVYQNAKTGKRDFATLPLHEIIEHQKQVAHLPKTQRSHVPANQDLGDLLFVLSPGDLVYNPTEEEIETQTLPDFSKLNKAICSRIYRMEKATGKECYFINHNIASLIAPYNAKIKFGEFKSQGKFERSEEDQESIKASCVKLNVDSLGNIIGYES